MSLHHEINFETEICEHMGAHGWLYETGVSARYDRKLALFSEDVIAWVQETQPKAWGALANSHGGRAAEVLLVRLREQLDTRGTLDVLRNGLELVPVKGKLTLAQWKPSLAMNPEIGARYRANRLRVLRQVRYSLANENSLDLVLFLNGIPVATAELKTDFTQSITDAVDQYRLDRDPRPKGRVPEPLLNFPGGALVHFAVSNSEVRMTTRLGGAETEFLPFNRGTGYFNNGDGGAGNPPSASEKGSGHKTAYLWEEVWERESWLEILGRFVMPVKDAKKQLVGYVFPRFHQLDSTRKLLRAVRDEGAGGKYLIQHSAGSGKTKSIAWAAHFLAELHDELDRKVFDTVLVVSDRNVIDQQLQEEIFGFQRMVGVVQVIQGKHGSKSSELAEALSGAKKVVVCTIQTFPALHAKMAELVRRDGRRYAVIADEAHSSQTGEAATKLKQVLSAEAVAELADGGEVSMEDLLIAQMTARANVQGITYVAFTATPKSKTLELFGRRPNPDLPASDDNKPGPFHVYSMRQAIEEEFILDVLRNWTSYKLAFRLAHNGREMDETEVVRSEATKGILRWVRLHPYNISQKVREVIEHFRENVQPLLRGHAKAMVVVSSRLEAVRWQIAVTKYIREHGYGLQVLVAFSGEVLDLESGEEPFTEVSLPLNPNLRGRDMRKAFATDEYQLLLVANKFQTGFDEKLLCGMYVDRRLGGIQAVQTLSRLNRAYAGPHGKKDTTFILDFVNQPAEILAAFKTYYATATLEDVSDPNLIYDLRAKLDGAGYYDAFEVDRVAAVELKGGAKQGELLKALEPVADRLLRRYKQTRERERAATETGDIASAEDAKDECEALLLFRTDIQTYINAYTFLSQIFDYGSSDLEKRALFFKRLLPLLEFGREREGVDLSKVMLTHHSLRNRGNQPMPLADGDSPLLKPLTDIGSGSIQEKERALLAEIIERVNGLFAGDMTDGDKLVYVNNVLKGKLLEMELLVQQAQSNSKEQFAHSPDLDTELINAILDTYAAHTAMSKQAIDSEQVRQGLKEALLGPAQLYEALRARGMQQGG